MKAKQIRSESTIDIPEAVWPRDFHGHVVQRPDGTRAKCGAFVLKCSVCIKEKELLASGKHPGVVKAFDDWASGNQTVNAQSPRTIMQDRKFRSLEEVRKYLKEAAEQLHLDEQIIDKNVKQLARLAAKKIRAADELKIVDISGDGKSSKRKRTLNVDFPMVKVPDAQTLDKNYKVAERLSEQYKYLLNLENEVKMNFKGTKGSALDTTLGSIAKLKSDVEVKLKAIFLALAQVAEGHAPKQYKQFVQSLAEEISSNDHVECESARTMTYAALNKEGDLVFAGYIILVNAVSDEGKVAPTLYIVIKWTVGGDVEIFVEHEFVAPSLLEGGDTVVNIREAAKSVASQLSLEGFSSQIGNLPVAMQIKEPVGGLRPDLFSASGLIQDVKGAKDELIFTLKPNVTVEQIEEIKGQLYQEVRALVKRKRNTTVRMSAGNHDQIVFTFIGLDHSGGIHPQDLNFLGESYKLDDGQLRKIANVVNNGPTAKTEPKKFVEPPKPQTPESKKNLWHSGKGDINRPKDE